MFINKIDCDLGNFSSFSWNYIKFKKISKIFKFKCYYNVYKIIYLEVLNEWVG